ncbi:MAG: DUF58 domain-containing protein [Planctomycetes bacterium]|nr:DUF58 domain-containing protein [Planctomycetota bacterium]
MIPRARLSCCLALALAAAGWGAFDTRGRLLAMALDALFFGLAFIDFARTPRPRTLRVERTLPARAGLGIDFKRTLRLESSLRRAAGLALEIDEEFGPDLEVRTPSEVGDPSGGPERAVLPASGALELVRSYRSRLRGVHRIGHVRVRISSPWRLWWRQERLGGEQTIEIEPPLLGLRRTLQLAESERWRDPGVRKLRRRGGQSEFESLRELVQGDDLRLVDWKAFAKRGRPIVRQFQEERGQELILVFDAGRRMSATSADGALGGWSKLDHALDAGLQIAAVALRQGDRVGALAFDSRVLRWIPPMRSAAQQERLRDALFDLEATDEESDLERALRELGLRHRRRAYVVILSDVADPLSIERQKRALRAASRRHKVLFAALDDPALREQAAHGGDDALLRAAAVELMDERATSLRALAAPGVRVLDALPAEAAAPLLAAWLSMRRGG